MSEATPRPWRITGDAYIDWIEGPSGEIVLIGSVASQRANAQLVVSTVNACYTLRHDPDTLEPDVRVLVLALGKALPLMRWSASWDMLAEAEAALAPWKGLP